MLALDTHHLAKDRTSQVGRKYTGRILDSYRVVSVCCKRWSLVVGLTE